jgi:outer membrane receptor for ferrienterochelin and colicins
MDGIATRCRRLIFMALLLAPVACLFGQNAVVITVSDSSTKNALSDAIVRVMPLAKNSHFKGTTDVSDKKGQFNLNFTEPLVVHISYLGYNSIFDTIYTADSRSYFLKRTASNIEDVVVTGQYAPGSAKASVYNMTVYTEKDFREKGATNLREALQGSMNMSQDPIFGSGLSVQGISGEGVKIMVDGVPLVGRQNGVMDLSQIDVSNNIERVELIKGPMSAIYGSDAMGGVVNLITKSNQTEKYNVNLRGYYESVGQYNVSLNSGLNLGKSQLFVSGGRNFFDGYSEVDTSRHKDWLPKEQYFANAKYVYTTGKFKVGASLSFFREHMINRGNLEPNTSYAFDYHFITMRPVATLFATVPIRDFSRIELMVAYSGYVNYVDMYRKDLVKLNETLINNPGQPQDTSIYHTIAARGTYTLNARNKKVSFQFGVDINQQYTIQNIIADGRQEMGDYAAFGSVMLKLVEGLDIQPAVRFSYNTKFRTPLIPSLNIKYDFKNHFTMRASYGRGYRAPSLTELYLDFHDSNHNLNGNPDLKAESGHSVNFEFGYHVSKNDHNFRITPSGFFNKIDNKIDYVLTNSSSTPQVYQEFNINKYMNSGAELSADYSWKRLSAAAGFNHVWYWVTVSQAQARLNSGDFTLKGGYKIPKAEIKITLTYKYTGRKPLYAFSSGNESQYGSRDPFNSMDVSLSRNFWKDRIQLTCGAKNLFNVTSIKTPGAVAFGHNSDPGSTLTQWGRTYFISLNLHFAK